MTKKYSKLSLGAIIIASLFCANCSNKEIESGPELNNTADYSGWRTYAGSKGGNRYSSNEQINAENVSELQVAWRYSTGDKDPDNHSQIQCNPIMVDGVLYWNNLHKTKRL